jgi:MSHA biogenesis protein MshP
MSDPFEYTRRANSHADAQRDSKAGSRQRGVSQRGVSLIAAIFLIVVLALLAAVGVRLTAVQQQTVGVNLRAAQAFHAARSGLSWAAHRALNGGWCGSQTLNLTEAGTSGFDVTVTCTQSAHVEAGAPINVYTIVALAEAGVYGGPDYVSRRIEAKVTDG